LLSNEKDSAAPQRSSVYQPLAGSERPCETRCWYDLRSRMKTKATLRRMFPGSFNFFRLDAAELRRVIPDPELVLPQPQRIFLDTEEATPFWGFAILMTNGISALREALEAFLQEEEALQISAARGQALNKKAHENAWQRYQALLERCTENAVRSSFGRRLPSIFWLYHSVSVSRLFKEMPRRLRRRDLDVGKSRGDTLKYRIYDRFLDRVLDLTYNVVHRVADEAEEAEKDLFPDLLARMRDNVLILTEDHISSDLSELDSYFHGCMGIDGKDFRARLLRLQSWQSDRFRKDPGLRSAASHLLAMRHEGQEQELFRQPGYVRFLSEYPGYDSKVLLEPKQVNLWESLLIKLKEFEVLLAQRRMILPVKLQQGALTCQSPHLRSAGGATRTVRLSQSTRPLDFTTSWVIDPLVRRCGLIYDITDFSAIVSVLGRSGSEDQDSSYRSVFRFQRWVNQTARSHRLQLEKYLGDGALYSGRHPSKLIVMALELQRYYERALSEGFPFDRGMRIALNFGEYRLLPIEEGGLGGARRYEFFGHGIVELTRLATGKAMREIDEIKHLLVEQGYEPSSVEAFFAPATRKNVDLIDKEEEARRFYSYINQSGALVNEGIVATREFLTQLEQSGTLGSPVRIGTDGRRSYLVLDLDDGASELRFGIRRLGLAHLKGLERMPIYEIVDGSIWDHEDLGEAPSQGLLEALDREPSRSQEASLNRSHHRIRPT